MFYICKVIKCETAMDDTYDYYQHCIPKGTDYIVCKYLEKTDEKKGFVFYKQLKPDVFVLAGEVFCPCVNILDNLKLTIDEYQYL